MSKLSIVTRALEKYQDYKDEPIREAIATLSETFKETARLTDERLSEDVVTPEWSRETIETALKGEKPLITACSLDLTETMVRETAQGIAKTILAAHQEDAELQAQYAAYDWTKVINASALELIKTAPESWLGQLEASFETPLEQGVIYPSCLYALRVLFSPYAREASEAFRHYYQKDDTLHFDRALKCPFCGGEPLFAHVAQTTSHGNEKSLVCSTCLTKWPFERIRCAVCGESATSELSYVHDEADTAHRLHTCGHCGSAFPTAFQNNISAFSPDIESLIMLGLEAAYFDQRNA